MVTSETETRARRTAPIEMSGAAFRTAGHALIDQIAEWLETLPGSPVARDESPADVRRALQADRALPDAGTEAGALLDEAAALLFEHSLFNGHPRFFGYITSSAGADRHPRRSARVGGEPERRRMAAVAGGDRDRGADGPLDRGADRVSRRLRRAARERRQHGELRLLPRRARREGAVGRADRRAARRRARRCASTRRPRRTRGSRRRRISPASAPTRFAGFRPTREQRMNVDALDAQIVADMRSAATCRSSSSAPPAR